jgi:3-hydroxyisobutyrate dehydrogenase
MMEVTPQKTCIGWIGVGVMGASMAGHLLAAGYRLTVSNRSRAKAEPLIAKGATWAETPREVAAASDVVFTMVGYPHDAREVILGEEGVLAGVRSGAVLADMTTSEPSLAVEIAERAAKQQVIAIDAPVSGGDVGARNAALSIMIGGDEATVTALDPLWSLMGKTIVRHGAAGAGQHAKMVNQTLVAAGMVGVCEALLYAHQAQLDLTKVLESVSSGAATSWSLQNLGPRMIAGDFRPGFYVEHFLKDLKIVLDESRRMGLALPGLALCEQLYRACATQGHARKGTHSLILALAELSNVKWGA